MSDTASTLRCHGCGYELGSNFLYSIDNRAYHHLCFPGNNVDKAEAWDAIAEKNATIARLRAENEALRKERDDANADRCFHTDDDPNCKLEATFMRMVDGERARAEAAEAENERLTAGGTRKAAECERLKREKLHAGKLQSQYAGRLRRATDQANALGAALDIERARALAAEARADKAAEDMRRLREAMPLIQTALEHASFALDGIVAMDDEDMGKDGGSATTQHTKRTVDRALKAVRTSLNGGSDHG